MAERRMFAKTIIDSDAFLDMPLSSQAFYFHLSMRADDDGFINNPKKIQRMVGASDDDFKLLIAKSFLIPFESGIVVIKHWKIHNYIQSDRYKETVYLEEKGMLKLKENKAYTLNENSMDTQCIQDVSNMETQVRLGKDSIDKDSIDKDSIGEVSTDDKSSEPPVITLMLKDKTEYGITQKDIEHYKELYPAVDIMQELRNMKGWCESNPTKRKTRTGVKRFITGWLSKEKGSRNDKQPNDIKAKYDKWSDT